jgi:hypothetical protein
MIARLLVPLLLSLAFAGFARAAGTAPSDDDMARQCRGELESRLFAGATHGDAFVTDEKIHRDADRVIVRLDLASGEGRTISGSCIFRGGKLFDVK